MESTIEKTENFTNLIESIMFMFVSRMAPFLVLIGPSFFVGLAIWKQLSSSDYIYQYSDKVNFLVSFGMAFSVESVGMLTAKTAMRCWSWNKQKSKNEPNAPVDMAITLVFLYIFCGLFLSVGVEIWPKLQHHYPSWSFFFDLLSYTTPATFFVLAAIAYVATPISINLSKMENNKKHKGQKMSLSIQVKKLVNELKMLSTKIRSAKKELGKMVGQSSLAKKDFDQIKIAMDELNGQKMELKNDIEKLNGQKLSIKNDVENLTKQKNSVKIVSTLPTPDNGKLTKNSQNLSTNKSSKKEEIDQRREKVLDFLTNGEKLTDREIAKRLGVSKGTISGDRVALNGEIKQGVLE